MNRILLFSLVSLLLLNCKKDGEKKLDNNPSEVTAVNSSESVENKTYADVFDVNSIPEVSKALGDFPYYSIPDWLEDANTSINRNLDFSKMDIYTGNSFYTVEGPVHARAFAMKSEEVGVIPDWNEYKFQKSFEQHFESLGAKKIWQGSTENLSDQFKALNAKNNDDEYSFSYSNRLLRDKQTVYALKQNGKLIFFVIGTDSASGGVLVCETAQFEQTISTVEADELKKK